MNMRRKKTMKQNNIASLVWIAMGGIILAHHFGYISDLWPHFIVVFAALMIAKGLLGLTHNS
ncbi:hypothetical protein HOL34_03110 [bacterium]|nr:hypothetical protein [bacterium]MBT3903281.1 hypothetical protein [bacterium]MBT4577480.1 hypothetical protein [bacterium]MBT5345804.1 hypothetical protein [bacterium]MBT6130855.1 hypothetical protein [bacterium]